MATGRRLVRPARFSFLGGALVGLFAAIVALPLFALDPTPDAVSVVADGAADAPTGATPPSPTASAPPTAAGPATSAEGVSAGPTAAPATAGATAPPPAVAAPTTPEPPVDPGATATETAEPDAPLVDTGPGVTDDEIVIGFLLYGAATASGLGFADTGLDPDQQQRAFQSYVDETNEGGGIAGRRIRAVYATFDILSPGSERQACLQLTEDADVMALVGNFFSQSAYLCATAEHERVLLALGATATSETFARSNGLLFTNYMEGDRTMQSLAAELQRLGHLDDYTFGIVSDDGYDTGASAAGALRQAIEAGGGTVGHHAHLAADFSTGSSQVPIEVQRAKAAGVDAVLLIANPIYSTQFVREAEGQRYLPQYFTSDYAAMATDVGQSNMPDSYAGTLNFSTIRQGDTRADLPEESRDRECREIYETRTGERLTRDTTPWGVAMQYCNLVHFLDLGLQAAGTELTSAGLSRGLQSLGSVEIAAAGGGRFAPGKFGYNDLVRTHRWESGCRCMVPVDEFHVPGGAR